MHCLYIRKRKKKNIPYLYCKCFMKKIKYEDCKICKEKKYKQYKKIKKKTTHQSKREKERFSIIYKDLTKCCVCGSTIGVHKNEIFEGAYRQLSMKLGMIAPMCYKETCHKRFHNDIEFNLRYKVMFQQEFMKNHSLNEFLSIFKQDYIYKYNQFIAKKKKSSN